MKVRVLGHTEVRSLLPMAECVDVMAEAFVAHARGETIQPARGLLYLPNGGALAWMPAYVATANALGAKALTVFNANSSTPYPSHQGPVLLFEPEHGRLLALLDAATVTAVRTAAASACATRLVARPEATRLAILGNGTQAMLHIEAMCAVRAVSEVRVWGRSPERVARFARAAEARYGVEVRPAPNVETAVADADIVCTTTASPTPILRGEWLPAGVHVNAVGAGVRGFRELDAEAVARCRVYVDARAAAEAEADELTAAVAEGRISANHVVGEIGEVLLGKIPARGEAAERTLFKSVGLAIEDVAAARFAYDRAERADVGSVLEFGGERGED